MSLAVEFTPFILSVCRRELAARQTRCEFPEACNALAAVPYRNKYSFVYLCDAHFAKIEKATGRDRADLDNSISRHMYQGLLAKSYVWNNNQSGGALDELVDAHQAQVAKALKAAERANARTIAAQRGLIQEHATKVGAPDEELLVGRDRNDLRKKFQQPARGPEPKVPVISTVPAVVPLSTGLDLITPIL